MKREELTRYLDELLEAGRFRDYCPNGLQVEGKAEIGRLADQPLLPRTGEPPRWQKTPDRSDQKTA